MAFIENDEKTVAVRLSSISVIEVAMPRLFIKHGHKTTTFARSQNWEKLFRLKESILILINNDKRKGKGEVISVYDLGFSDD